MRCRRCSHELSSGADRCLRCFALNPQNVEGPLFAGLDSDPPKELRVRFDDEPPSGHRPPPREKAPGPLKPRKHATPPPPSLPFPEIAKTPAPPPVEISPTPAPRLDAMPVPPPLARVAIAKTPLPEVAPPPARRLPFAKILLASAIDLGLVGALLLLHIGLAIAVLGPERLAPGPAGSVDYWFDLFRGGGLSLLWALLAATLALAYGVFSALLLGRTPGLATIGCCAVRAPPAAAKARSSVSRLPRERSAP
jgi:hypothetical protein